MFRIVTLTCLLLTSGCSALLVPQINVVDSPYPKDQIIEAVLDFHAAWLLEYGEDVWFNLDGSTYNFYGMTYKQWTTPGGFRAFTQSPTMCSVGHVTDRGYWGLHKTAIFHEMVHMTFWATTNDPDNDHEEGSGPWTEEHNDTIRQLKIDWEEKYPGGYDD